MNDDIFENLNDDGYLSKEAAKLRNELKTKVEYIQELCEIKDSLLEQNKELKSLIQTLKRVHEKENEALCDIAKQDNFETARIANEAIGYIKCLINENKNE